MRLFDAHLSGRDADGRDFVLGVYPTGVPFCAAPMDVILSSASTRRVSPFALPEVWVSPFALSPFALMTFAVGRSRFWLSASTNAKRRRVSLGILIQGKNAQAYYQLLRQDAEQIETEMGHALEWEKRGQKRGQVIC